MQTMPTFGLPRLEVNPFTTRPLEAGEEDKLVGRSVEFQQVRNFLQYRSPRRLMLVGPLGSGRTSMMRCLQPYAASYATVEHLPAHSPGESLLEALHSQLIGQQAPHHWSDMVRALVDECASMSRGLPLVVIDVPASDTSVLSVALRDTLPVLERLNALVVIVCDHQERRQLPPNVTGLFEQIELRPLSVGQVLEMVHHRMAGIGQSAPDFNEEQAQSLLDGCDGYPHALVTALRNAVDALRMRAGEADPPFTRGVPAKPMPRDGPYALGVLSGSSTPPNPSFTAPQRDLNAPQDEQVGATAEHASSDFIAEHDILQGESVKAVDKPVAGEGREGNFERIEPHTAEAESYPSSLLDPLDPDILDASTPWHQRPSSPPEQSQPSIFELDFGQLRKDQAKDDPLLPLPTTVSPPLMHDGHSPPPLPKGVFGGLARRNREDKPDPLPKTDASWSGDGLVKEGQDEASEFWVAPGSLFAEPSQEEDSLGAVTLDENEWIGHLSDPQSSLAPDESSVPVPNNASIASQAEATVGPQVSQERFEEVHAMVSALVMNLNPEATTSLLSFFERRQQPKVGSKVAHPLNHIALNALDMREAYVIGEARLRWVSPSDATVLEHLDVKRSRLSQICNRLLRFGILEARRVGKYRKYKLTQAAEAQLTAWGALEEAMA